MPPAADRTGVIAQPLESTENALKNGIIERVEFFAG